MVQNETSAVVVTEPDPGPLARLEAVKGDVNAASVVFQRLTAEDRPETLRGIAKAWGVPVGRFVEWFTTEHSDLWAAALKVQAFDAVAEAVDIADEATPDDVSVKKLRSEIRKWKASKFHRELFGDSVQHQIGGRAVLRVDFGSPGRTIEAEAEKAE